MKSEIEVNTDFVYCHKTLEMSLKENAMEKSSSSLSSISPPLNTAVSPPHPTATSAAVLSLPISVAPQKVPKPSNMKRLYVQTSKMNILSNVKDVL